MKTSWNEADSNQLKGSSIAALKHWWSDSLNYFLVVEQISARDEIEGRLFSAHMIT